MAAHDILMAAAGVGGAADPDFEYVTLLLHGDGTNGAQNNTFTDGSTNNFTITRNGNTTQGTFSPYGSNWSNYFDGTGDNLTVANNVALQLSGDWTVEGWFYIPSGSSGYLGLVQRWPVGATNRSYYITAYTGNRSFYTSISTNGSGNSDLSSSANAWNYDTWTHFAFVVSGGGATRTIYVNGVSVGSSAMPGTPYAGSADLVVGGDGTEANYFKGNLSNVRVVKGTAVYTANFTPPTAPLTAIAGTSLLTCQANRFLDASSNAFTITRNGDVSVQRFSPFSPATAYSAATVGGSGYFDGTGDSLSLASDAAFGFGTGTFTIEFWTYVTSTANTPYWIDGRSTATANEAVPALYINGGNYEYFVNSTARISGGAVPLNQWVHVALVRNSGTTTLYSNGVSVGTWTDNTNYANCPLLIGQRKDTTSQSLTGYISNLRIVKGTAVYTAGFTPPTAPLTAITNTSLLLNFTNAGIIDNAMMNDLETVGNAQISTSVKKYGTGSLSFDGTGDWLFIPSTPTLKLVRTEPFTVECWVYPLANHTPTLWFGGGADELGMSHSTRGRWIWGPPTFNTSGDASLVSSSTSITANTWAHLAVTCDGAGNYKIWVNGTNTATASSTKNMTVGYIGYATSNAGVPFDGYIDDLRITKGVARYTGTFTPPAQAFADN